MISPLGRSTSIRLKSMSESLNTAMIKLHENQEQRYHSHTQEILDIRTLTGQTIGLPHDRQQRSWGQSHHGLVVTSKGRNEVSNTREIALSLQNEEPQCNCCSHEKYFKRSPHVADKALGTLFVGYSDIPFLISLCKSLNKARSCTGSHFMFSLAYFFPIWFLSCAILLIVQDHPLGFDINLRVLHYVSYSSPIFQCAYQGDSLGMKSLLKRRLASPFDVTAGPRRSLLGVRSAFSHNHSA